MTEPSEHDVQVFQIKNENKNLDPYAKKKVLKK